MGYGHRCRLPCGPCPFILPRTPLVTTWSPATAPASYPAATGHAIDLSLEELEREARGVIGEMAYAYFAGGADDERLLAGNVEAWARWQLHPRVLAGVAGVDLATTLLGTAVSSPVVVAPTAVQRLAHDEGEIATARGAAAVGALMVLSSLASCSLEEVAAVAPGAPRWMQVYILRDRARTVDLVGRAAAHGYGALVLTVDTAVSGLRLRELRGGVRLPPRSDPAQRGRGQRAPCARRRVDGRGDPRVRSLAHARRHRVAGRSQRAPRGGQGCPAGRRRRAVRRGRERPRSSCPTTGRGSWPTPRPRRTSSGRSPMPSGTGPRCTSTAGSGGRPTS